MERGAFFGSILGTANHLLWADLLWMSRFDGGHAPVQGVKDSTSLHMSVQRFADDRRRVDQRIQRWAGKLTQVDLIGPLTWYSAMLEQSLTRPKAICVTHFFNHQTHHRGQLHAMLTKAGQTPDDTDLIIMPEGF